MKSLLQTRSLDLVPHRPEHLRALIEGVEPYERQTGYRLAQGLREYFGSGDVSPEWLAQLRNAQEPDIWTHGFALVHRTDGTMIGTAGFKGPPTTTGTVEIAYGVAPGYQGKGHATEAAKALTAFAFGNANVRQVIAHTRAETNASTRVLTKCGFRHAGEVIDPEDGLVWRWEKDREQGRPNAP